MDSTASPTKGEKRKGSDIDDYQSSSGVESPKKTSENGPVCSDGLPWTTEQCLQLIDHLRSDHSILRKNFRWALKHMDWEVVKIGDHDADSVRQMTGKLMNRVRKFRTLAEMLDDCAKEIDEYRIGPLLIQHPKRPPNPYMMFYHRHVKVIRETHPDVGVTELAKIASDQYADLPDKKRRKYQKRYVEQREDFDKQMVQLRIDHPEIFTTRSKKKLQASMMNEMLPKPKSAKQNYLDTQVDGKLKKYPGKCREKLVNKFSKKWQKLSQELKESWLRLAVDGKLQYIESLEEMRSDGRFCDEQIDDAMSRVHLSKADAQLKLAMLGKPKIPPVNGYQCFVAVRKPSAEESTMSMIARACLNGREWKDMTQAMRDQYKQKAKTERDAYARRLKRWKKRLDSDGAEFVRKLEAIAEQRKRTKAVPAEAGQSKAIPIEAGQSKAGPTEAGQAKAAQSKFKIRLATINGNSEIKTEKEERQTTIIEHFSPRASPELVEDVNQDSSDTDTPVSEAEENNKEDSDEYYSPGESDGADHQSLNDFKLSKGVKPRPALQSAANHQKTFSNLRLSPPRISPMVNDTPSKKLKKKQ